MSSSYPMTFAEVAQRRKREKMNIQDIFQTQIMREMRRKKSAKEEHLSKAKSENRTDQ